ncbi:MAG TPA: PH domain-containing protein [Thermomicrobiales bacterium]|nr:PH domain-containing protein [Thermomicrobiales bacterium]
MSEPHRLHPAAIALMAFQIVRQFAIPALIPIAIRLFNEGLGAVSLETAVVTIVILVALLGLSAAYGVLAWHRFTYRVEAGELRIEHGIVNRQRRFIPLERIQTFDSSQGLLQRLLGVVSVRVETAGGGGGSPEVSLPGVSQGDSERLRQALAAGRAGAAQAAPELETARAPAANVWKLSATDLLLAGSTGGRAGVALSIILAAVSLADNLIPYEQIGGLAERVTGAVVVLGLALALAAIVWLLGVAGTILAHAGFTITQQGDHLLIERGLLERRRATIPIERIQAIRIIEGVLRQPFGLVELRVESAGYGPKAGESTVLCPLLRRRDVQQFLTRMAPSLAVAGTFQPLPRRARRRYALQLPVLIQPLVLIVPVIYFFYPLGLLGLLLLPAVVALGLWQYHDAGWAVEGDTLLLRWRAIARTTAIVPRRRIQLGSTHATPFQRRVQLSTLTVRVPSGPGGATFGLLHMDHETALRLLAWLGPRR